MGGNHTLAEGRRDLGIGGDALLDGGVGDGDPVVRVGPHLDRPDPGIRCGVGVTFQLSKKLAGKKMGVLVSEQADI